MWNAEWSSKYKAGDIVDASIHSVQYSDNGTYRMKCRLLCSEYYEGDSYVGSRLGWRAEVLESGAVNPPERVLLYESTIGLYGLW